MPLLFLRLVIREREGEEEEEEAKASNLCLLKAGADRGSGREEERKHNASIPARGEEQGRRRRKDDETAPCESPTAKLQTWKYTVQNCRVLSNPLLRISFPKGRGAYCLVSREYIYAPKN